MIDGEEHSIADIFRAANYARALGKQCRKCPESPAGPDRRGQLAYTTIQTTPNVLQRNGKVKRKLVGRAYEYSATVSQESADSHALKDVLQKVSGSEQEA